MPIYTFSRERLPASPWKNGGGVTREIVCQPPGAGMDSFAWRISIAHIARDGPFSAFPGVDRVITLLEGDGVHLRSTDGTVDHRLDQPLHPFAFSGEAPVDATLLEGDCHDFNVMTRRQACQAHVQVFTSRMDLPPARAGLLMAVRGDWQVGPQTLEPGHGLWWDDEAIAWALSSQSLEAALLAVRIEPVSPGPR